MPTPEDFAPLAAEMTAWRRHLHAHPEIAFEEHATAAFVAERLRAFGVDEVHPGLAGTGVVGVIRGRQAGQGRAIGLRADMDALAMQELSEDLPYKSTIPGRMHACGHDGHTTMLLGAAKWLAETRRFAGTVHLIFQPAEENAGGGRVMVEEGLFRRFPCAAVYGMHNMPGLPLGSIAVQDGAALASSDSWEAVFRGQGTHGAKPHLGTDATVAAAQFILAVQTIASRMIDPLAAGVVSVAHIAAGVPETWNVIPAEVRLRGTARAFSAEVRALLEERIGRIARGAATAQGVEVAYRYIRRNPPTVNHKPNARMAAEAARRAVGENNLIHDFPPSTAGEDFSWMLDACPGAYVWLGTGPASEDRLHHNPRFDFNDAAAPAGAAFWAALVETELPLANRQD